MIDIHTHVGRWGKDEPDFDEYMLLSKLDKLKIEKAVLLPVVSPESFFEVISTKKVLEIYKYHPDRIIPFCNLDPRNDSNSPTTDFSWILKEYEEKGCKGVGEITANLCIDDSRCKNLFFHCGEVGFPVLFHLAVKIGGVYGLADEMGLPRLEKMLKELPDTIFIGHAMGFWSEISTEVYEETRGGYPKGAIKSPGRIPELLSKYPNLYGDLSAGSGYNAIIRDPDYGYKFLDKFQDKLLFGTDICHVNQEVPIVSFFRESLEQGKISKTAYQKITYQNAQKLLKL